MDNDFSVKGLNMPTYTNSGDLLFDARNIIDASRKAAYRAINVVMLQRNWLLGKRIHEEILGGKDRADYGAEIVKSLSKRLTEIYGRGFNKNNLYAFVDFYKIFPTLSGKSELLSWSHYYLLLDVQDDEARRWYAHEAFVETWSVHTLRRNISSQYYYRLLQSQNKQPVMDEMHELTATLQNDKLEFVCADVRQSETHGGRQPDNRTDTLLRDKCRHGTLLHLEGKQATVPSPISCFPSH